jgi:TPR repeat protein
VPTEKLDADAATVACKNAVREFPAVDRFKFQLARALNKAGHFHEAARYYEPLANAGYVAAAHDLSVLYVQGAGVPKDSARALDLLRKSAAAGFALSQYQLGLFYSQGAVVARDLAAAASWFRRAADQGFLTAENCPSSEILRQSAA